MISAAANSILSCQLTDMVTNVNFESESNVLNFGVASHIPQDVWFPCIMCTWSYGSEESLAKHKNKKHK